MKNEIIPKGLVLPGAGSTDPMSRRSEFVDNLITTTWQDVRTELFGEIFQITPFLDLLFSKGNIKGRVPNGRYWEVPIAYGKSKQNQQWFSRGTVFGSEEMEIMTTLQYVPKFFGDSIVRYYTDEIKNKGKAKILDYVQTIVDNHKESITESLQEALWLDAGPLALTPLPTYISKTPDTGVVGGIDRSANPYLQNQVMDFSGSGLSIDDLISAMRTMYHNCSRLKGKKRPSPDMILTTQEIYEIYEDEALAMGQIQLGSNSGTQRANLGFGEMDFKGAKLYWDPNCPAGEMYFLNSDTIEFTHDPEVWLSMTDWKPVHNTLDRHAQVVTVAELTFNNFAKNGVIHNIA